VLRCKHHPTALVWPGSLRAPAAGFGPATIAPASRHRGIGRSSSNLPWGSQVKPVTTSAQKDVDDLAIDRSLSSLHSGGHEQQGATVPSAEQFLDGLVFLHRDPAPVASR